MKKLVIVFMAAILLCLLAVPVMAASDEANLSANALYELGLFLGTGKDENGNPNFDLDRAPTRHEAVVMLVRLLGKEEEAKAGTWETPFTDVIDWAEPYVGYAYENGLTAGTSATTFGGDTEITVSQYLTFVLRALGYASGVDFQWDKAWELSDKLGITNGQYNADSEFTRGDVAIISSSSLAVPEKGETAASTGLAYEVNEDLVTCTITGLGTCTDMRVVIPETIDGYWVTGIAKEAFADCKSIAYIEIPESVYFIGERAFYGCTGLTKLTVPASVIEIGAEFIENASNLHTIYYYSKFGSGMAPALASDSLVRVVFGGEYIPWNILQNVVSLKEVEILDGVASIKDYAFEGCINLQTVKMSESVTSIGRHAFKGCSSLLSIEIPESVTKIPMSAFQRCSSLTSVAIPDTVTSIDMNAFESCSSLTEVVIPDSVTSIGTYIFSNCSGLTSVQLPKGLTSIPMGMFQNCQRLTDIEIPDGVTSIGKNAFWGCGVLTDIALPDGVTSIGSNAFQHCYALTDFAVPVGVTNIDNWMFRGNSSMTSIEIPNTVTSMGEYAIADCRNLTSIQFDGTTEQWNAIEKAGNWDENTNNYTVYCTDGTITK